MPETGQITFTYKEVVETLVKANGIHDGIWGLFVKFGLGAANMGDSEAVVRPTAIIPLLEIGLIRMDKENNISVDAAKVNPKPESRTVTKQ